MKVLITAGQVYGPLDDNKLLGNRVRGIWACEFAGLLSSRGHEVTLLVPDTFGSFDIINGRISNWRGRGPVITKGYKWEGPGKPIEVIYQKGFDDYMAKCLEMAPEMDAAILAAAVVNWIPAEPFDGKMPTEGYKEGDIIQIPLKLATNVIRKMKKVNPKLTLVGCKMLSGATEKQLLDTAYDKVLIPARCNVVIANDMRLGLKTKWLVYKDRSAQKYDNDFNGFFESLYKVLIDEHWHTASASPASLPMSNSKIEAALKEARETFDRVVNRHRNRFNRPTPTGNRVFGSLAVRVPALGGWLCSPREKGSMFTSKDAVLVLDVDHTARCVWTLSDGKTTPKATLNAPLLIQVGTVHQGDVVLHLHEQLPDLPTVPYGPPGTVRDNNRKILGPAFNIEGHGFVKVIG